MRRLHRRYGTSLASGEMKADASREVVTEELLRRIASEPVRIIAVTVDKAAIVRPPQDSEDIYRVAASLAVRHAVRRWPRIEVCLDKRYTTKRLRNRLEQEIREASADLYQEDSVACKPLQAADYVAWALFQKHERGDCRFYDIIASRIVVEQAVANRLW